MKLNWGTGIAIFYTIFVISLVSVVIISARNNVDLVEKEYYKKDINYEAFRVKRENGKLLSQGLDIGIKNDQLIFSFPKELGKVKGTIHLFRPSNSKLDAFIPIDLDEDNNMTVAIDKYPKGLWRTKTEWEVNGIHYFNEEKIIF